MVETFVAETLIGRYLRYTGDLGRGGGRGCLLGHVQIILAQPQRKRERELGIETRGLGTGDWCDRLIDGVIE